MLILNHQEVIYCQVVRPKLGKFNKLPGLTYHHRLFCQVESYQIGEYKVAVNRARQIFDAAEQRLIFLLVEEPTGYSIWCEDSQLISVQEFESKFAAKTEIPLNQKSTNFVEPMRQSGSVSRRSKSVTQDVAKVLC